jgi:hypothetical protein
VFIVDRGENLPKGELRYLLKDRTGKALDSSDSLHLVQMMYGPKLPVITKEVE